MAEDITSLVEQFEDFLNAYCMPKAKELADNYPTRKSLEVAYSDLEKFSPELADELLESPDTMLEAAESALRKLPLQVVADVEFTPHVRFFGLPPSTYVMVETIGAAHIGKLISVDCMVTKRSEIKPKVKLAVMKCRLCDAQFKIPIEKNTVLPETCDSCKRRALVQDEELSNFVDLQRAEAQEPLEHLRGGAPATHVELWMEDDLVNTFYPGQRLLITGILRITPFVAQKGKPQNKLIYSKHLEVMHVQKVEKEFEEVDISSDDKKKIVDFSKDVEVYDKIRRSIAPSIYGHDEVKEAIALQLFGGTPDKHTVDGGRIRNDVHVLLIGDPGSAKTRFLQFATRIAPKSVYVSGKSVTGAGLTASAEKDDLADGGWTLKAGALVLASNGIACLHPDSKVIADSVVPIGELFDEKNAYKARMNGKAAEIDEKDLHVQSFDRKGLRSSPAKSILVARKPYNGKMIELQFRSGFKARLTPEHPLVDGDSLEWKKAGELKTGDFVLAPLKLNAPRAEAWLLDIIPGDWKAFLSKGEKEELRKAALSRFKTLAEFNRHFGIGRHVLSGSAQLKVGKLKEILYGLGLTASWKERILAYGTSKRGTRLTTAKLTKELGYLVGFIYGDGYVKRTRRRPIVSVSQSLVHNPQITQLAGCYGKAFGNQPKAYAKAAGRHSIRGRVVSGSGAVDLRLSSRLLAFICEHFTKGSHLRNLLSAPDEFLRGFLAGALDSDGCISIKNCEKGGRRYKAVHAEFLLSRDEEENLNFLLALRRFDCYGRVIKGSTVSRIRITGRSDVDSLLAAVSGVSVKHKRLPEKLHAVSGASDKLPSIAVSELAKKIGTNRSKLVKEGVWSTLHAYMHRTMQPSRQGLSRLLEVAGAGFPEAQRLLDRDYFLEEVVSAKPFDYEGYVYDLYVPGTHCFVSDGILVHNSVDEFDKIDETERASMHEVMESGTVSVAKAGIVATFNAKTSILAAANPKYGRFDANMYPAQQFDIAPTLLSRFDLIFPIRDVMDEEKDKRTADHILQQHMLGGKSIPAEAAGRTLIEMAPPVDMELLRKYIAYARKTVQPVLTPDASDKLKEYYVELRKLGAQAGAVPITARYLDGLARLSEASAKTRLSQRVEVQDAQRAIALVDFVLRATMMDKATGRLDVDIIATGQPKSKVDKLRTILDIVKKLEKEFDMVEIRQVLEEAGGHGIEEGAARQIIDELLRKTGDLYEPQHGFVKLVRQKVD